MAYINGIYIGAIEISFRVNEKDPDCLGYSEIKRRVRAYTGEIGRLIESKANYGGCGTIRVREQKAQVWRSDT